MSVSLSLSLPHLLSKKKKLINISLGEISSLFLWWGLKKGKVKHFDVHLDPVPRTGPMRSSWRWELQRHVWGLVFIVDYFPGCMLTAFTTWGLHWSTLTQIWVGGTVGEYKNWGVRHGATECGEATAAWKIRCRLGGASSLEIDD